MLVIIGVTIETRGVINVINVLSPLFAVYVYICIFIYCIYLHVGTLCVNPNCHNDRLSEKMIYNQGVRSRDQRPLKYVKYQ